MHLRSLLILVFTSLFLIACGDDGSTAQCDLGPQSCSEGLIQVSECSDPSQCKKIPSGCSGDSFFLCEPDPACADVAPPECDTGYIRGDLCESLGSEKCILKIPECHPSFYCNPDPDPVACRAIPTCDVNDLVLEGCMLTDTQCKDVTICDQTIACTPSEDCEAIASCGTDEISYQTKAECEADNENCRQTYKCSTVIWCGGNDVCMAPDCGNQTPSPDCVDPEKCDEIVGCGRRVVCEKENL